MLVSFNWLKQYVNLPDSLTPDELALKLTMSTVEVEGVKKQSEELEGIVIGLLKKIKKHPNADKLKICIVNDGKEDMQVVCGGSNLKEKMLVAFAPVGTKVRWHGEGDLIELKKVKIRGEESLGMICQSTEIGLGEMFPLNDEAEIIDLTSYCEEQDEELKLGVSLAEALSLNDVIFDIDNKSMTHRPDLWGHYGMAREVVALYHKDLDEYNSPAIKSPSGRSPAGRQIKIEVKVEDKKLCSRYMAVAVEGVKVEESPDWLQKKLLAVGLRPINNIVDITNYVLYDLGQPMHAFDAAHLNYKSINVRRAEDGERFKTLDGGEHKLDSRDLVIADKEKVIALAGVMGGENSGVSEKTTTVVFESANFDATTVRRTSTRLGLRTDSSARFEKSLDPNNCELALRKAVELTLQLCPDAKIISNVADESDFNLNQEPIELLWEFLWKKIGMELDKKEVIKILQSLGFKIKEQKEGLLVVAPTWRATKDISIPEDLVEEVARIYGYDNVESNMPTFPITPPEINELRQLEKQVLDTLVKELSYSEVYNYSFVSADQIKKIGDDVSKYVELDNPISKEKSYVRRNLLLNLLENVDKNIEFYPELRLVEIGKTFLSKEPGIKADKNGDDLLPRQDTWLTAICANKKDKIPFWQIRQTIETICHNLNLNLNLNFNSDLENWQHPTRFGGVVVNGKELGSIYELHPLVANKLGLEVKVGILEINLNKLLEVADEGRIKYNPLPACPEVIRDLAVIIKEEVIYEDIIKTVSSIDPLLKKVELFDVYAGKNIGEGYKSMAFRLTYGSEDRTLTAGEVDGVQEKAIDILGEKFGAEIRG